MLFARAQFWFSCGVWIWVLLCEVLIVFFVKLEIFICLVLVVVLVVCAAVV